MNGAALFSTDNGDNCGTFLWQPPTDLVLGGLFYPDSVSNTNDSLFSIDSTSDGDFQLNAGETDEFNNVVNSNLAGVMEEGVNRLDTWFITILKLDFPNTTAALYVNGVERQTSTMTQALGSDGTLGMMVNRSGAQAVTGHCRFFFATEDLTDATRQLYEGYMAWAAGTGPDQDFTALLPSGHPYKNSAPPAP